MATNRIIYLFRQEEKDRPAGRGGPQLETANISGRVQPGEKKFSLLFRLGAGGQGAEAGADPGGPHWFELGQDAAHLFAAHGLENIGNRPVIHFFNQPGGPFRRHGAKNFGQVPDLFVLNGLGLLHEFFQLHLPLAALGDLSIYFRLNTGQVFFLLFHLQPFMLQFRGLLLQGLDPFRIRDPGGGERGGSLPGRFGNHPLLDRGGSFSLVLPEGQGAKSHSGHENQK